MKYYYALLGEKQTLNFSEAMTGKLTKSKVSLRKLPTRWYGSCFMLSSPEFCSTFSGTSGHISKTLGNKTGVRWGPKEGNPLQKSISSHLITHLSCPPTHPPAVLLETQYCRYQLWQFLQLPPALRLHSLVQAVTILLVLLFLHFTAPASYSAFIMKHFWIVKAVFKKYSSVQSP